MALWPRRGLFSLPLCLFACLFPFCLGTGCATLTTGGERVHVLDAPPTDDAFGTIEVTEDCRAHTDRVGRADLESCRHWAMISLRNEAANQHANVIGVENESLEKGRLTLSANLYSRAPTPPDLLPDDQKPEPVPLSHPDRRFEPPASEKSGRRARPERRGHAAAGFSYLRFRGVGFPGADVTTSICSSHTVRFCGSLSGFAGRSAGGLTAIHGRWGAGLQFDLTPVHLGITLGFGFLHISRATRDPGLRTGGFAGSLYAYYVLVRWDEVDLIIKLRAAGFPTDTKENEDEFGISFEGTGGLGVAW